VADDELADYVDGTLDPIDAEIVASHLEECAACTADVRDLQSFRAGWTPARDTASRRPQDRSRRRALTTGVGFAAAAAVVTWIVLPHLLRTAGSPDASGPRRPQ
jgi:anti-sigma factor RsiW